MVPLLGNTDRSPAGDRCSQPASAASDSPGSDGTAAAGGGAAPKGGGRKAGEGQEGWCLSGEKYIWRDSKYWINICSEVNLLIGTDNYFYVP